MQQLLPTGQWKLNKYDRVVRGDNLLVVRLLGGLVCFD